MPGCVSRDVCELSWFWVGRLAWLRPLFVATSLRSGRRPWGLDHRGGIGTTQESKTPRTGASQGQSFCVNLIARQSGRPMRRVCVRWNGPAAVWGINQFNRIRPIEQKSRKRKTLVGCVCETRSIDWELARAPSAEAGVSRLGGKQRSSLGDACSALSPSRRSLARSKTEQRDSVSCLLNLLLSLFLTTGYQSIDRFDAPPGSQFNYPGRSIGRSMHPSIRSNSRIPTSTIQLDSTRRT